MIAALTDPWSVLALVLHFTAAIASAVLAYVLQPKLAKLGPAGPATVVALVLTALWSLSEALELRNTLVGGMLEGGRNLLWLLVVYRLFEVESRREGLRSIRVLLSVLVFVEVLHLVADTALAILPDRKTTGQAAFVFGTMMRLLVSAGALVLLRNLYGGATPEARRVLRWPAAALAALWCSELNLYLLAYLAGSWPREIAAMRGLATVTLVALLAIGASEGREAVRLKPSRAVTFQTFSLLLVGAYVLGVVLVSRALAHLGSDFARLVELAFLTLAGVGAVLMLPSQRLRGWLRVTVSKHLFQHRYDYREEWLRFARTIGNAGAEVPPLGERAVQALADVTDSRSGLLLAPSGDGDLALAARWNWAGTIGTANADGRLVRYLERQGFIVDLDELRDRKTVQTPGLAAVPAWLVEDTQAWALVPLIHYERLIGVVVLARPELTRKLDWEDFDLLRVIGTQLASYLAENASQEALAEASHFEDFHRRIAFVMHDIKNLASQFSLLARNAELHAEKKAFRDDMLVTLRNSSEKLNALIARLSRYGSGVIEKLDEVRADEVAQAVVARFGPEAQVVLAECRPLRVLASRHSLEQVLVHLIQNAIDASPPEDAVFLSLVADGPDARFEVVDAGQGMSPEFVRNRLFKPFVSTKSGGFGIGAFEARELVRAMRGRLDVDSREGLGSHFVVRIPLYEQYQEQRTA